MTSTALVAAGALTVSGTALAQGKKPVITLGGSTEQIMGFSNNDNPSSYAGSGNGVDQHSDAEVHFNSAITLDNGINIRTRIELEGNTSTDQIDEHWMRISGSFGGLTLGSQDGASQIMVTGYQGSWSTGVGQNLSFDVADWIEAPTGHAAGTVQRVTLDGDAEKITYFTPRFMGFQLGASYIPNDQDDINNTPADRDNQDHEGWQFGANYVNKFGDIGLGAAIGYAEMKEDDSRLDDQESWGFGVRVDFGGFRVGVGYVNTELDASSAAGGATKNDTETFDLGARYTFGPNAVSLTYQNVENENGVGTLGDEETQMGMLSYRRTLGPGVNWTVNGMWADYDGRQTSSTDDNDGYALTTSIKVRF